MGRKAFAIVTEELKNEDPNLQNPPLSKLFEHTRKRNEKRKYVTPYDDTADKIAAMKDFVPSEDGTGPDDAFKAVMGEDKTSHMRLRGRGVTKSLLKKIEGSESSYMVSANFVETLVTSVESEKNKLMLLKKEIDEDHERKKAELEEMRLAMTNDKQQIVAEVMEMLKKQMSSSKDK